MPKQILILTKTKITQNPKKKYNLHRWIVLAILAVSLILQDFSKE